MGQGDMGTAQSTMEGATGGPQKVVGASVARPWVLLGWDLPPHFEVEILILAVGAPKGLGPVGAKVGGSTHALDG